MDPKAAGAGVVPTIQRQARVAPGVGMTGSQAEEKPGLNIKTEHQNQE